MNFFGRQIAARTGLSTDLREFNTIKAYATVNAAAFVKVDDRYRLTFSVTNLFDRIGQEYYGFYPSTYITDSLGRRFTMGARVNF